MSISVILPIWNGEKTIKRCLNSIINQTLQPNEIICILNKCTDKTENILIDYIKVNGSVKILKQDKYQSIVPTLNKGLYYSTGEYIARIDHDDQWFDNKKLEKQVDFLNNNPEVSIIGTQMFVVNKETFEPTGVVTNNPLTHTDIVAKMEQSQNCIAHPSVLFKRDMLLKTGGYTDTIKYTEDYELWLKAIRCGFKLANLEDICVNYSQSSNPDYSPLAPQLLSWCHRQITLTFPK